jgi:hypothetical protein
MRVMARIQPADSRRPASPRGTASRFIFAPPASRALLAGAIILLAVSSCQSPDPVTKEKARTLSPDERYLVDYYMKIIEFEKYLHDNPGAAEEKRGELEKGLDKERIRRTLNELEKRPERWLAIYNRINELQLRILQSQPTGQY